MSLDHYKDLIPVKTRVLALPGMDRFRGSDLYRDGDGREFYESWVPRTVELDDSDRYFIVDAGTAGRLDLIAYQLYQDSRLRWLLAAINDIFDVLSEPQVGAVLRYPLQSRLMFQIALSRRL